MRCEPLLAGIEVLSERIREYNEADRDDWRRKAIPQVALLKQIKGVGTLIALTFLLTLEDAASFPQEPRRGLLSGSAAGTKKLRPERAADAHQQGRRSLSAHAAGARSAPHSGAVWSRLRSATLGPEAGRARRKEREEASHYCDWRESWPCCCITCG